MGNDLLYNPLRADTAATIIDDPAGLDVLAIQWLDDSTAAVVDADDLKMTINGVSVEVSPQDISMNGTGLVWEVRFCQPFKIFSLIIGTIDGGCVYVWKG
jgi:hypothetical protein